MSQDRLHAELDTQSSPMARVAINTGSGSDWGKGVCIASFTAVELEAFVRECQQAINRARTHNQNKLRAKFP